MKSDRVASLDFLRGLAAACVAGSHFLVYRGTGGQVFETISVIAVEVFFVLSGYVLAPQILLILSTRKLGTLWTFLMRRWMRTVPAYLVALLLVSAFAHALGSADFWHYLFYVQNLFWQDTKRDYYSIAWSLSVEEWFYLTFPLFLLAASLGRGRGIRYYAVAAILFILSITILRTMLGNGDDWGAAVRRVVVFRIDSIAYGFLLYLALRGRSVHRPLPCFAGLIVSGTLMFLLLNIVEESRAAELAYPLAAAAFGALSILSALSCEAWAERRRAICNTAGATSYAVYLYHLLAIYVLAQLHWTLWLAAIGFIAVTSLLAAISTYGLEKPILAMRPKYSADIPSVMALSPADAPSVH